MPAEHRLAAELSEDEREIIMHAFGADSRDPGYRDHYCTDAGDLLLLRLAWELGLFSGPHGERQNGEPLMWAGAFFYLTDLGKHVARSMLPLYR